MVIQVRSRKLCITTVTYPQNRNAATPCGAKRRTEQRMETHVSRRYSVNARFVGVSILCCLGLVLISDADKAERVTDEQ